MCIVVFAYDVLSCYTLQGFRLNVLNVLLNANLCDMYSA